MPRPRLNREQVLAAAVALADECGLDAVSMRSLADQLGVVPMAMYKHVASKDELVDAMVAAIVGGIERPEPTGNWPADVRAQILAARHALLRHPWARQAIESRTTPTPALLAHLDAIIATLRRGGVSADLAHHAMHALGSRIWGFSVDLFESSATAPPLPPEALAMLAAHFPHVAEIAAIVAHDPTSVVGGGCDDQFEFEFALDLLLDGIAARHRAGWTSPKPSGPKPSRPRRGHPNDLRAG